MRFLTRRRRIFSIVFPWDAATLVTAERRASNKDSEDLSLRHGEPMHASATSIKRDSVSLVVKAFGKLLTGCWPWSGFSSLDNVKSSTITMVAACVPCNFMFIFAISDNPSTGQSRFRICLAKPNYRESKVQKLLQACAPNVSIRSSGSS